MDKFEIEDYWIFKEQGANHDCEKTGKSDA